MSTKIANGKFYDSVEIKQNYNNIVYATSYKRITLYNIERKKILK